MNQKSEIQSSLIGEKKAAYWRGGVCADSEEERRRKETQLQLLDNAIQDSMGAISIADLNGNLIYNNPACISMFGFDNAGEINGKNISLLVKDIANYRQAMREALICGSTTGEFIAIKKDGTENIIEARISTVTDTAGKPIALTASLIDITERKRAEETVLKFKLGIECSSDAIFITEVDGTIVYVNDAFVEIYGFSREEALGKTPRILKSGVLKAEVYQQFWETLLKKEVIAGELVNKTKDGSLITVEGTANPILDKNGEITGFLTIQRDTTARKQAEEELNKTREQLQRSRVLASLGEMTAGIAHEVNNPLGSVLLYSELLMAGDISPQTRKDLKVIHHEAKRAAKVMTDLLVYGRKVKPQMRRVNLDKILTKVLSMRRYRQKIENINAVIHHKGGPLYAKGDFAQLMQAFINIVLNAEEALKENGRGNIIIQTETDGEWARVSIADNGPGIPGENIEKIFYPFFSTKKIGEGIGLGLSTCFGIIASHNGMIRVEQNEMGGATFVLDLPLATNIWQRKEKVAAA